ncbi:hypothetical protein NHX12_008033 [Muraenolepis orangiensis]|uniref:Serine and arginine rich splicing factor 7a n=1 Tax=Muraenolepis orangiensis TaxID=630683 RepID=A0A9Q0DKK3_9TELE|nr:hypothetical protein NHX12_008033 [Muraenolepis orangiensis]
MDQSMDPDRLFSLSLQLHLCKSPCDEDDDQEERLPSCYDYVMHFVTVFWKVLFACVPPTELWNGWACFCVSISSIGLLTAVIGDLASHFGCTVGLRDSVTAVVFVALGTSIPDTFASKVAATQDQHADASVGNVTGSNAVNVFLGIGVAWSVAAIYWASKGKEFRVDPGSLAFSVTLFTIFAFFTMGVLLFRRRPSIGGELGGPRGRLGQMSHYSSSRSSSRATDCKVYVGDLGNGAAKGELERAFSYYGPLRTVWVARNPPGFAFVEYEDPRDAEDAVKGMDGKVLCGSRIRVELSTGMSRKSRGRPSRRHFDPNDRCYQCGDRGHYAYDCYRFNKRGGGSGGGGGGGGRRSSSSGGRRRSPSYSKRRSR